MQLSTAIRLGALLKPQAFHGPSGSLNLKDQPTTCALAAAAEAIGEDVLYAGLEWHARWPVSERFVVCPSHACPFAKSLITVIAHLNDGHQWTRDRIADWVESIERRATAEADAAVDPASADLEGTPCN